MAIPWRGSSSFKKKKKKKKKKSAISRERNDQSFEDCEKTVVELKSFFFKTLPWWVPRH
jgi:hypothetical protein